MSDKTYTVPEFKELLRKHLQDKIDQVAQNIASFKKRELSKADLLGDSHIEPGTHEAAQPGVAEHTEPGVHEKFALTPGAVPGSEAPSPVASSVQQPAGDVDPCLLCGQPDVMGSCQCLGCAPVMKKEGGTPVGSMTQSTSKGVKSAKPPKADGNPNWDGNWNVTHEAEHGTYHSKGVLDKGLKPAGVHVSYTSDKTGKRQHLGTFADKHQAEAARLHHHDKVAAGIIKDEMDMGMEGGDDGMDKSENCPDCSLEKSLCKCMAKTAVEVPPVKGAVLPEKCVGELEKGAGSMTAVPQAKPPMPKAGLGMAKAGMPMTMKTPAGKAMAVQHGLADASKQAKTVNLAANGKAAAPALSHPGDATRSTNHAAALGGAFTPKAPVVSGLELDTKAGTRAAAMKAPPKLVPPPMSARPVFGKSEMGDCAICSKAEHDGECP